MTLTPSTTPGQLGTNITGALSWGLTCVILLQVCPGVLQVWYLTMLQVWYLGMLQVGYLEMLQVWYPGMLLEWYLEMLQEWYLAMLQEWYLGVLQVWYPGVTKTAQAVHSPYAQVCTHG